MIIISSWQPIHKFLVQHQVLIKNLFFVAYILCFALISFGFYAFNNALELYLLVYSIAGTFGTASLYLFLLCLLPGIFQRFRVFTLPSVSIILFRRQMGILMYCIALLHSFYLSTIPGIMTQNLSIENFPIHSVLGMIALSLLFPVWITSNDFSQKKLGKFWKTVQRMTYIAMLAIFVHVALVTTLSAILTAIVLVLELTSWLKVWFLKSQQSRSVG